MLLYLRGQRGKNTNCEWAIWCRSIILFLCTLRKKTLNYKMRTFRILFTLFKENVSEKVITVIQSSIKRKKIVIVIFLLVIYKFSFKQNNNMWTWFRMMRKKYVTLRSCKKNTSAKNGSTQKHVWIHMTKWKCMKDNRTTSK